MKWKWIVVTGIIAGAAAAARRRNNRVATQGQTWAAATDPVAPSDDS